MGVILCRRTDKGLQALLIQRRYTYAYVEFLHGRDYPGIFNHMTVNEVLDIATLDFRQMWRRVWLDAEPTDFYYRKLANFNMRHLGKRRGKGLLRQLRGSKPLGTLPWCLPRGQKKADEDNIVCAVREFEEETRIKKKHYTLLMSARPIRSSYIDNGRRYIKEFYVGYTSSPLAMATTNMGDVDQISEVATIRWMTLRSMNSIDTDGRLRKLVRPAFKIVRKYLKGISPASGPHWEPCIADLQEDSRYTRAVRRLVKKGQKETCASFA